MESTAAIATLIVLTQLEAGNAYVTAGGTQIHQLLVYQDAET